LAKVEEITSVRGELLARTAHGLVQVIWQLQEELELDEWPE
jgi:hypothetical protein